MDGAHFEGGEVREDGEVELRGVGGGCRAIVAAL